MSAPELIEWAWAGRALEGTSGDLHVVVQSPHGALVALIDGLGHGPEAAAAADAAAAVLEANVDAPLDELLQQCHGDLRKTRGAVMSVALLTTASILTWGGIGNIEGVLIRDERPYAGLPLRGGIIGYNLPRPRFEKLTLQAGDTLVMTTDGVRSGAGAAVMTNASPDAIAESIIQRFAKLTDDACALVVRYNGASG